MGFLGNAGSKAKAKAAAKAKETGKNAGLKIVHGRNRCKKSPSGVHQWGREVITTTDDEGNRHKFTVLTCRHGCGAYKD